MAEIRPEVIDAFQFQGTYMEGIPYGSGHINDTFRVTFEENGTTRRYILQRMNKTIFLHPEELMENVTGVTQWLRKKILEKGGDPERETLNLVPTKEDKNFFVDQAGDYWRAYIFIEGAATYDLVQNKEDFYQSAVAFGHFQGLLADYPAQTLHETIVNFHNTVDRFAKFKQAEGKLPLRVTHNDTKLNNIMIDDETRKAICVIDLDTVMPGLAVNDFGDSIRFGASTAEEDERDLSKVSCSME